MRVSAYERLEARITGSSRFRGKAAARDKEGHRGEPQWPIFVAVTTRLLPLLPSPITITEMLFK